MDVAKLLELYRGMQAPEPDASQPFFGLPRIEIVSNVAQGGAQRRGGKLAPQEVLTSDELLLSSLHFACPVVARYAKDREIYVPQLDPYMIELNRLVVPFSITGGIQGKYPSGGWDFAETPQQELSTIYYSGSRAAQELMSRIGLNIYEGLPLSKEAGQLAAGLIWDPDSRPKALPIRPSETHRDTLLVALAKRLSEVAGYAACAGQTSFRRGKPPPVRGCTLAAAALYGFGILVTPQQVRKVFGRANTLLEAVPDVNELLTLGPDHAKAHRFPDSDHDPLRLNENISLSLKYLSRPI